MKKTSVKIGVIGLGIRGRSLVKSLLACPEVDIVAICDLCEDRIEKTKEHIQEKRNCLPVVFSDYKVLIADKNVEAVVIATSWDEHTRMAVESMRAGKYTALEVAGAYDLEDCWQLVRTYEETKTPIMFLENCCFDKFELLTTSLARAGKLGKILYCRGTYGHELRGEILGGNVNFHYRLKNYMLRNCENYPTHELGPIAKLLNINRGNKMISLTSVATKGGVGLEEFVYNENNPDPSLKGTSFAQGDVVVTTITCAGGEVITLCLDTTLPRPYGREFTVRGTKGFCAQDLDMIMLDNDSYMHEFYDMAQTLDKYPHTAEKYKEYLPSIWANATAEQKELGHGGMDYFECRAFVDAILNGTEMPIDVYDMASWMAITPLSEQSIAHGGMPQAIPDFTRGKWMHRPSKDVVEFPKIEDKEEENKNCFGYSRG